MNRNIIKSIVAAALVVASGTVVEGRPSLVVNKSPFRSGLKTTATNLCDPAAANIDLDINNVRARLMTGGDMWWDIGTSTARYEVPKGSGKNSLFAGSCWIGGLDHQTKVLKVAAQSYRQTGNDYWPGPIILDKTSNTYVTNKQQCDDWDYQWKVNRTDINAFIQYTQAHPGLIPPGAQYDAIVHWPAAGNDAAQGNKGVSLNGVLQNALGQTYAPFVDVDNDGKYDATAGDYPDILGDQMIWWVFNDVGNNKTNTKSQSLTLEVQTSAFAFATKNSLNNTTFVKYRLINRGTVQLDSTYIATWTDADLGFANDDYIGCDTARSLGIMYNGKSVDGTGQTYAYGDQVPMVGVDFFVGPTRATKDPITGKIISKDTLGMTVFNYFTNGVDASNPNGDPGDGLETYRYMTGTNRGGQHLRYDFAGAGVPTTGHASGPEIDYVYPGDPSNTAMWSECACNNLPGDRRFIHSSGPFILYPGADYNDVIIGAVWVANVGGCPNTTFTKIRAADDVQQELFDAHFKLTRGPDAPRLVIKEMDRKLVCYMINDEVSNNYDEKYGYDLSKDKYRSVAPGARKYADSLYKFEGYRVFQVANSLVTAGDIVDQFGQVDPTKAIEVFQTDIKNGTSRIINYSNDKDISDTTWSAHVMVNGKDSGISHSFVLTQDFFATSDKRLVNYKSYYYIAIAYGYNEYAPFNPSPLTSETTQSQAYIESTSGPKGQGSPILTVAAMPNPANGTYDSVVHSDYGDGVVIQRLEGVGDGGNDLVMDDASEQEALSDPQHKVRYPKYLAGRGPVQVKVVDPTKVTDSITNFRILISGHRVTGTDSTIGIDSSGMWKLVDNNGNVLYQDSGRFYDNNEAIAEQYGLSINVHQVARPGDASILDQGNGLITSEILYEDSTQQWLAGLPDGELKQPNNWIRSGSYTDSAVDCNYDDVVADPSRNSYYENLLPNNTAVKATWAPYADAAWNEDPSQPQQTINCGFGVVFAQLTQVGQDGVISPTSKFQTYHSAYLYSLPSVDIVFTKDKTLWTRCAVVETQSDPTLSEGHVPKFRLRSHASWNMDYSNGVPKYSTVAGDTGMSYFPGYAINVVTGERLNIVFGEDSWNAADNGRDMLWNPTSTLFSPDGQLVSGGKHFTYIFDTKYDEDSTFMQSAVAASGSKAYTSLFYHAQWVGIPTLNFGHQYTSLELGMIPTKTRIRFRVNRPYDTYVPDNSATLINAGQPVYGFSTEGLARTAVADAPTTYRDSVLNSVAVVPNPYYAYAANYEVNRLDTRVRIINLPKVAHIQIYSLDGTLIRKLEKTDGETSYVDWDIRNAKGLPIASGMYLIHVEAEGFGDKVIRWFGAMRPVDINTY